MLKNKPTSFTSSYLVSIELWDVNLFDTFSLFSSKKGKQNQLHLFENNPHFKTLMNLIISTQ